MRAVVVDHLMDARDLRVREVPEPEPGPGIAVVEVRAAGVNFFDTLIIAGKYQIKPDLPFTPGGELAGVVCAPPLDGGFAAGERVYAHIPYGAYAQKVAVPVRALHRMPDALGFDDAAAMPIVYPTSYAALVLRAGLRSDETLLVHAAAGGVGLAAVQIGKALGARVIATAGGAQKLRIARDAGADVALDYRSEDWVQAVMDETNGRGADVIYDPVGGEVFDRSFKCVAWNGRVLVIGFASGTIGQVKANRVMLKNVSVVGVHWGAYAQKEPEAIARVFAGLAELSRSGLIRPLIFGTYALDDLPRALEALASRATWGKLIVHP